MTATQILQAARTTYAMDGSTSDDLFTDAVMLEYVNREHRRLADLARLYKIERSVAGSAITTENAQYYVVLADDVLEVDKHSVHVSDGTSYTHLKRRLYPSLVDQYGPLSGVARGVPLYFYQREGSAAADDREFGLLPGPNTTIVALATAVRYRCWIYPADLAGGDTPGFSTSQHDVLVPAVCRAMAETEYTQGRLDASVVELWRGRQKALWAPLLIARGQNPAKLDVL